LPIPEWLRGSGTVSPWDLATGYQEGPTGFHRGWWREPPHLRLLPRPAASTHGEQWYSIGFAPRGDSVSREPSSTRPVRMASFLWGWRAPTADSVALIRFAALSVGLSIHGEWLGDTLRGRAHGYSDVVSPDSDPRSNAYGVRYNCESTTAVQDARRALADLVRSDRSDTLQNAREAAAERARWDSLRVIHP